MVVNAGDSGNPAGRAIASRNRKTLLAEDILAGHCEDLMRRLVERAMSGDGTAMRLCQERVLPRMRDRPVVCPLPTIAKPGDVVAAAAEIQAAVCAGALSPREGMDMLRLIDRVAQAVANATEAKSEPGGKGFRRPDDSQLAEFIRRAQEMRRPLTPTSEQKTDGSNENTMDRQ
jgi:hypothetical protein